MSASSPPISAFTRSSFNGGKLVSASEMGSWGNYRVEPIANAIGAPGDSVRVAPGLLTGRG